MNHRIMRNLWVGGCILGSACGASGQEYQFQIDPASSGGSAQFHVSATTSGTLIGNYDPATTPDGTRTKPGFFAPGATENVAVPVNSFNPDAQGTLALSPAGTFRLNFDPAGGVVRLTDFSADLLGGKPASIPVSTAVSFSTFRTANPSFTYLGLPLDIPVGDATVSELRVLLAPGGAQGTLTPLGGDQYAFSVTPQVILLAKVAFQGTPMDLATQPTALPLSGQVTLGSGGAVLQESGPLDLSYAQSPNLPMDPLPYDLPGASTPAHVIFNLTLKTEQATVSGTQSLGAVGTVVPEPGTIALVGVAGAGLCLRRRWRR